MSLQNTLVVPRLDWPADWSALFGRAAPLLIEIGFGGGQFLLDLARRRPETNMIGLEISLPSLRKVEGKVARAGLSNVRLMQATAQTALWALFQPAVIGGLVINFPDPWPKEAHHNRRLISGRFLHLAATRLQPAATLDIATDHADYAQWILEHLQQTPYFASRLDVPYLTEDRQRLRTKYELKALAEGRTCHYFKWRRNETPVVDEFPIPQELPMPHALLRTPLNLAEISDRFEGHEGATGPARVRFIEAFQAVERDALLVDTYIGEEPMTQRVLLAITQRGPGEFLLHLHEIGYPRPTTGIHHAIRCLADWLVGLAPTSVVVKDNLQPWRPNEN